MCCACNVRATHTSHLGSPGDSALFNGLWGNSAKIEPRVSHPPKDVNHEGGVPPPPKDVNHEGVASQLVP